MISGAAEAKTHSVCALAIENAYSRWVLHEMNDIPTELQGLSDEKSGKVSVRKWCLLPTESSFKAERNDEEEIGI